MAHFSRTITSCALALLIASSAHATGLGQPLREVLDLLPALMPEPPFGALLFGALGWWVLMRRRPSRDED